MNSREQLEYFASVDHVKRFAWQANDEFVGAHEYQTIQPLFQALAGKSGLRVLESGCGEGINIIHLKQLGLADACIKGIDPSREAVMEAAGHGLDVQVADGLSLPFADESFDAVFCRDVLHHLPDEQSRLRFICEMQRVAGKGATITVIEPNFLNPLIAALALCVPAERGLMATTENQLRKILPESKISRVSPSCLWRMLYHYRSPFYGNQLSGPIRKIIYAWDFICSKILPNSFWSYRVYQWSKR